MAWQHSDLWGALCASLPSPEQIKHIVFNILDDMNPICLLKKCFFIALKHIKQESTPQLLVPKVVV